MSQAFRRQARPRPKVEALESRALLAAAGSLDPGFGGGYGSATAPLAIPDLAGFYDQTNSAATLPNGQVVVTGSIEVEAPTGASWALAVSELNADGSPNASFGSGGRVELPIDFEQIFTMGVQPNGQILEATSIIGASNQRTYLVVRLNTDGSLDKTFGAGGLAEYPANVTTPSGDLIESIASVLVQPDGKIILAGYSGGGFSAVRLDADGSLDTTYGTDGTATVPFHVIYDVLIDSSDDIATGAAIQADGKIVVSGYIPAYLSDGKRYSVVDSDIAAIRLNTDGTLDTTFGGSTAAGKVLIPPPPGSHINASTAVAIQPTTGDIVLAGSIPSLTTIPVRATLNRLNPDGTLDTTFGASGLVLPRFPGAAGTNAANLAVQANGDILLTSDAIYDSPGGPDEGKVELLRLDPDGSPDTSFGNTSTPGLLQTRLRIGTLLSFTTNLTPAIDPTTGDIILVGLGTISSLTGLTRGFTVDSILPAATTGPAALPIPLPPADLGGQGFSDFAIYDPAIASFYINTAAYEQANGNNAFSPSYPFGVDGAGQTLPAVADYQGLGYDQFAAYLPASGVYAIYPSATSPGLFMKFGIAGAGQTIPTPADYYGTGQADVAVYLTAQGAFAIQDPSGKTSGQFVPFGPAGVGQSIPAPADYYGTGRADVAVYLAKAGVFAIQDPSGKSSGELIPFGKAGLGNSIPVPGDYDGSGHVELAVYIPSQGAFYYRSLKGNGDVRVTIGTANSGELPVPGDYDGSGRTEVAIYDPKGGFLEYLPANGGAAVTIKIGTANDGSIPVATPAGDLPEFAPPPPPPGSGTKAKVVEPSSGSSGSTNAITLSSKSTVPGGPTLASIRVALAPVNQGGTDPLKFAS